MANPEHLRILKQGVEVWNQWRKDHPAIKPDLSEAVLSRADLSRANLSRANLTEADLSGAILIGAVLTEAVLSRAVLRRANLRRANLRRAVLSRANLTEADLSGAVLIFTVLGYVDLSLAKGLKEVKHLGPSTIGVDTLYKSQGKIPRQFLEGCGVPDSLIDYLPSLIGAQEPIQFYSCFISYSHQNEDFAKRLYSRMRDEQLRVWFALEDIQAGKKLRRQIDEAIPVYDKLLVVLSESSLKSDWVHRELRRARDAERKEGSQKLFPIRLVDWDTLEAWECPDPRSGKDISDEILEYFIPDFSNWKDHDAFEEAFMRLLEDLKKEEIPAK